MKDRSHTPETEHIPHLQPRSTAHVSRPHMLYKIGLRTMPDVTGTQPEKVVPAASTYVILQMLLAEVSAEPNEPGPSSITA
jgi:hypothetical protein